MNKRLSKKTYAWLIMLVAVLSILLLTMMALLLLAVKNSSVPDTGAGDSGTTVTSEPTTSDTESTTTTIIPPPTEGGTGTTTTPSEPGPPNFPTLSTGQVFTFQFSDSQEVATDPLTLGKIVRDADHVGKPIGAVYRKGEKLDPTTPASRLITMVEGSDCRDIPVNAVELESRVAYSIFSWEGQPDEGVMYFMAPVTSGGKCVPLLIREGNLMRGFVEKNVINGEGSIN